MRTNKEASLYRCRDAGRVHWLVRKICKTKTMSRRTRSILAAHKRNILAKHEEYPFDLDDNSMISSTILFLENVDVGNIDA